MQKVNKLNAELLITHPFPFVKQDVMGKTLDQFEVGFMRVNQFTLFKQLFVNTYKLGHYLFL